MKTTHLPTIAIALSLAVLGSVAEASADTTSASSGIATTQTQPASTQIIALQTSAKAPRTVGSVNVPQLGLQLSDFTATALTPQQFNAAYDRYVLATLRIDPAIAHTP